MKDGLDFRRDVRYRRAAKGILTIKNRWEGHARGQWRGVDAMPTPLLRSNAHPYVVASMAKQARRPGVAESDHDDFRELIFKH
jgi:hypothetical protein